MTDYRFVFDRRVSGDETLFRIRNVGHLAHQLKLFILPDDLPPLDAQLHGADRRILQPVVSLPVAPSGKAQEFVYDLAPGQRYGYICLLADPDGVSHALKGMNAELRPLALGGRRP
jgi:hypothetical protein